MHPTESEHKVAELILYVAGMGCRRCVREVTARLRDVTGVETVAADVGRSHVRLTGSMAFPDAVRALAGTTYRAEVVRDGVHDAGTGAATDAVGNSRGTEAGQGCP
jgi:copper chaperone CopZ